MGNQGYCMTLPGYTDNKFIIKRVIKYAVISILCLLINTLLYYINQQNLIQNILFIGDSNFPEDIETSFITSLYLFISVIVYYYLTKKTNRKKTIIVVFVLLYFLLLLGLDTIDFKLINIIDYYYSWKWKIISAIIGVLYCLSIVLCDSMTRSNMLKKAYLMLFAGYFLEFISLVVPPYCNYHLSLYCLAPHFQSYYFYNLFFVFAIIIFIIAGSHYVIMKISNKR
jgi:hypothetical protein